MNPIFNRPVLAGRSEDFPNYLPRTSISTLFLECNKHLLLLMRAHREDQPGKWGIPGGKAKRRETPAQTLLRELLEETQITLNDTDLTYYGKRYARIPDWDYIIHLFKAEMTDFPNVTLNPDEHCQYQWISIYAFTLVDLIRGQAEAFDVVYGNRIWQRVSPYNNLTTLHTHEQAQLILRKGDRYLVFDSTRRLVLNLIGNSGSGKGTQGAMLTHKYGVPNISAGDLFRDDILNQTLLGKIVVSFDGAYYPAYLPDEIPVGMMTKRLLCSDTTSGFIFDGFPRTVEQARAVNNIFLRKEDFHIPLLMDVSEDEIRSRLPQRKICPECNHQVREFDENRYPGFCPQQAPNKMVPLVVRQEDVDEEKLTRRFKMFSDNREMVMQTLSSRDKVTTFHLDNSVPPREVLHQLCEEIDSRLNTLHSQLNPPKTNPFKKSGLLFSAVSIALIAIGLFRRMKA